MRKVFFVFLSAVFVLSTLKAVGDEQDPEKLPGYFDFGLAEDLGDRETSVEVYVKEPLLSIVRAATRREEPELSELLSRIKLITVRTFSIDDWDTADIKAKVRELGEKLDTERWEKIVRVKDVDEQVYIYMKSTDGNIEGMVVIAVEYGDEAAFVNIVGNITPESLERLYGRFNIPELDSLETSARRRRAERER